MRINNELILEENHYLPLSNDKMQHRSSSCSSTSTLMIETPYLGINIEKFKNTFTIIKTLNERVPLFTKRTISPLADANITQSAPQVLQVNQKSLSKQRQLQDPSSVQNFMKIMLPSKKSSILIIFIFRNNEENKQPDE